MRLSARSFAVFFLVNQASLAAAPIATNCTKENWVQNTSVVIKNLDQRLRQLDDRLSDTIDKIDNLQINEIARYEAVRTDAQTFQNQRADLLNRMDFFESLRIYFNELYSNQPVHAFVMDRVSALIRRNMGLGISHKEADTDPFALELMDLKMALNAQVSNDQSLLEFIDGFFEKYSKSSPLSSLKVLRDNNYSNGAKSEPAKTVTLEEATEAMLNQFKNLAGETVPVMRMRMPLPEITSETTAKTDTVAETIEVAPETSLVDKDPTVSNDPHLTEGSVRTQRGLMREDGLTVQLMPSSDEPVRERRSDGGFSFDAHN